MNCYCDKHQPKCPTCESSSRWEDERDAIFDLVLEINPNWHNITNWRAKDQIFTWAMRQVTSGKYRVIPREIREIRQRQKLNAKGVTVA